MIIGMAIRPGFAYCSMIEARALGVEFFWEEGVSAVMRSVEVNRCN